jgi:hypothetical protein
MREQLAQQSPPAASRQRQASAHRMPSLSPPNPQHAGLHAGIPDDLPEQSGPFSPLYATDTPEADDDEEQDEPEVGDASYYQQRLSNSTRRYRPISATTGDQQASTALVRQGSRQVIVHYDGRIPRRASRSQPPDGPAQRTRQSRLRLHPLFYLGLGMFVMVLGWSLLNTVGTWVVNEQNTWRYGYPRVDQIDAVVGHHDSARHPTHLLALNLDGHIQIIEIPGGDATRERVYIGPTIVSADAALVPVTLSVADVNGDGKPDLLLHVQGQTFVWLNTGSQFQPPKS